MGLIRWLANKFGGSVSLNQDSINVAMEEYMSESHIRELALWNAVNLIANAISKCEFKTYYRGVEQKGDEYYLWNIEPNRNQNSSEFIHKWISTLLTKNECLIIEHKGELLVADDFVKKEYALYDDTFTNVKVKGFEFGDIFNQSDIMYFKWCEKDIKTVLDNLYFSYSKLITHGMKAYLRSRGTKGIFNYESMPVPGTEDRKNFDKLINEKFKKFMESPNAILPLGKGQQFEPIESKTYANDTTRDLRAQIDDISDFTAKAYNIPPVLMRGDVQGVSEAVDMFLTFCIAPLADMLQEEINRKRIRRSEYTKGTKTVIDIKQIKHVDLLSVSTSIDKLISSGCFCVNDIRKLVGEEPINEKWANEFFITKNYANINNVLNEGG